MMDAKPDWIDRMAADLKEARAEVERLRNAKAAPAVAYWRNKATMAHNAAIDAAAAQVTLGDTVTNTQRKILALKQPVAGNRGEACQAT